MNPQAIRRVRTRRLNRMQNRVSPAALSLACACMRTQGEAARAHNAGGVFISPSRAGDVLRNALTACTF